VVRRMWGSKQPRQVEEGVKRLQGKNSLGCLRAQWWGGGGRVNSPWVFVSKDSKEENVSQIQHILLTAPAVVEPKSKTDRILSKDN
jgi:hypothetical protein